MTGAPLLQGALVPGDEGWDDARRAWNLAPDHHPAMVALPGDAAEVAAAVRYAAANAMRVAVQTTGHGAATHADLDGALLVSTSRLRSVEIDPGAAIARVGGGARWEDVVGVAAEHGLAALHGSAPDVGIVGYTLGGGLSWLGRRHGLACNSVTAIELVLPNGLAVRVDAQGDPDLFWALRGGGAANFGVVTALEFRLYPVRTVHAGWLVWPWERAREVLGEWARWTQTAREDVTSIGRLLQVPPLPEIPEFLRGRQLVVVEAAFLSDEADAAERLAPLRALGPELDTFATMPAAGLAGLHMDPPEPVPGKGAGALIDSLPAGAVDALVAAAGPGSDSQLLSVEVRHLGGALSRIPDGAGALPALDGGYLLFAVGIAPTPEIGRQVERQTDAVVGAMSPWGHERHFLNFVDEPTDTRSAFPSDAYARLQAVRERVDPDGLMLAGHAIGAATAA